MHQVENRTRELFQVEIAWNTVIDSGMHIRYVLGTNQPARIGKRSRLTLMILLSEFR